MTMVVVPCAVCRGTTFESLYPSTIQDLEDDPGAHFSSSRRIAGHLAIVRCRACGLVMSNPRDDDETLSRVYRGLVDAAYAAEDRNRASTAVRHMKRVSAHCPVPGRLLDVGCATGIFAGVAHERGWTVRALDASTWAVERARHAYPGPVFSAGLLEDMSAPPESFDAITLWDVLEHVPSPADTLAQVRGWLAPGGYLFLNVPNVASATARVMGRRWVLLLREHLWYFAPPTIGRLLGQCAFDLVEVRPNRVRFSLASIARRSAQYGGTVGRVAGRLASIPSLDRWAVTFPIGEMTVVARKRS